MDFAKINRMFARVYDNKCFAKVLHDIIDALNAFRI